MKKEPLGRFTSYAVVYALGTLLGAAFFGMIPNALSLLSRDRVLFTVLAGIILFYLLEKMTIWRPISTRRDVMSIHRKGR